MRMQIKQLDKHLWLLDDAGESTCYVVEGDNYSMLIDTVNGHENLKEIVKGLTDKPLIVVNTHGHCDHIRGNIFFDEAWMSVKDKTVAEQSFAMVQALAPELNNVSLPPFKWLEVGQVFDLGGTELTVIDMKGHTPGSVGLLDKKRRILFSGDGANPQIWMQLNESLPIKEYLGTLLYIKENYYNDFDCLLFGHAKDYLDKSIIDKLIRACKEIIAGKTSCDPDFTWHKGTCKAHLFGPDTESCIVYEPQKQI